MVNEEKNPTKSFMYKPSLRTSDGESVCQGVEGHQLCDRCWRCRPGNRSSKHYLYPPAADKKACSYFRRKA